MRAPAIGVERAIVARLGAPENGQVHAWVLHAVGQMRSARRAMRERARLLGLYGGCPDALRLRRVAEDCVAAARASRRTARAIRNGGGR